MPAEACELSNPAVGKISEKNHSVSTIVPKKAVTVIDARRAGQSMTRSKYVSLIVSRWLADGCPPVNDADKAVRTLNSLSSIEKLTRKAS